MDIESRINEVLCSSFSDAARERDDPALFLRISAGDVSDLLVEAETKLADLCLSLRRTEDARYANRQQLETWDKWAATASAAGDHQLAIRALRRRHRHRRVLLSLADFAACLHERTKQLRRSIRALQVKRDEIRRLLARMGHGY